MTLSRTARILIAALLLAAAAFFWINFFSQEQPSQAVSAIITSPSPAATNASSPNAAAGASAAGSSPSTPASTGKERALVAPNPTAVATRDLRVAQLPFLVTQPPAATVSPGGSNRASSTGTSSTGEAKASTRRLTVNPFSPIVVQAAAAVSAPNQPTQLPAKPPAPQQVTNVPAPTTGAAASPPQLAAAPAPQPLVPPPPQATGLPHALPSGMLPITPSVLQATPVKTTRTIPSPPEDLAALAALREPAASSVVAPALATVSQSVGASSKPALLQPLGPSQPRRVPAPVSAPTTSQAGATPPLQAGTDALSRYLRDNDVRFTGTVLGPVSVGVFRSTQYRMPAVVSLGQDLPDTKITLTDLRGHEAVFRLNDSTQTLSLDLRR